METFISHNIEETKELAKKIANQLCAGKVVLLYGTLGAGKTTFTKALIKELGFDGVVTSPTFSIYNVYQAKMPVYHFDMYRIEDEGEATEIGIDEIFEDKNAISIVEWPEKVEQMLPEDAMKIKIYIIDENTRKFVVEE